MIACLQSTKAPHNPQPWIFSLPHSRGDQAFEEQEEWVQSCGLTGWFACCCCCCLLLWVPTSSRKSRAHTHSLFLSSSVFLLLPESSFSAAVLQGNPKDPTVLYRSPTRVPEGPNRPLKQAYKGIRRTPLVHCSSPSGNPKEPCIVCSTALRGVWKTSSIPLQQPYKGNLKDPEWEFQASSKSLVPFSSTKESLNLGTIWRKGHT